MMMMMMLNIFWANDGTCLRHGGLGKEPLDECYHHHRHHFLLTHQIIIINSIIIMTIRKYQSRTFQRKLVQYRSRPIERVVLNPKFHQQPTASTIHSFLFGWQGGLKAFLICHNSPWDGWIAPNHSIPPVLFTMTTRPLL